MVKSEKLEPRSDKFCYHIEAISLASLQDLSEMIPKVAAIDERQLIKELASLARRQHYYCEDRWYSCPKEADGCANDAMGDECNCGADEHNAKVDALMQQLKSLTD